MKTNPKDSKLLGTENSCKVNKDIKIRKKKILKLFSFKNLGGVWWREYFFKNKSKKAPRGQKLPHQKRPENTANIGGANIQIRAKIPITGYNEAKNKNKTKNTAKIFLILTPADNKFWKSEFVFVYKTNHNTVLMPFTYQL